MQFVIRNAEFGIMRRDEGIPPYTVKSGYKATSSAAAAAPSPQGEGLRRNAEDSVPYKKE